jgi:leucyl aminopeptidase
VRCYKLSHGAVFAYIDRVRYYVNTIISLITKAFMKHTFTAKKIEDVVNTKIVGIDVSTKKQSEFIQTPDGKMSFVLGVPKDAKMTRRKLVIRSREIVRRTKNDGAKKIALDLKKLADMVPELSLEEVAEIVATNFEMANYDFTQYKAKPEDGWKLIDEVIFLGEYSTKVKEALRRGKIIGEEVNKTRSLSNTPGGAMTPTVLAKKAQEAVKGTKVKVKVLNKKEIEKLKMGALLGVAQGSVEQPKFIIMEYMGGGASQKPIVYVGKGVTFDTGGLNLKPGDYMLGMNMDMSGGAAVIHAVALAARLKIKRNIVGLIPAVENSPSGHAYRPGDVLKSMSGRTIEVLNTDAEGRLILADALTYAKRYKPTLTVDVATLTGAMLVALGTECSGVFTRDDKLAELSTECGEKSGDYVWRMPLWEEYEPYMKAHVADIANVAHRGPVASEGAGSTTAAIFLYEFAKDLTGSWMHIDMASRMVANAQDNLAPGAVGAPVRLLLKLAEEWRK